MQDAVFWADEFLLSTLLWLRRNQPHHGTGSEYELGGEFHMSTASPCLDNLI